MNARENGKQKGGREKVAPIISLSEFQFFDDVAAKKREKREVQCSCHHRIINWSHKTSFDTHFPATGCWCHCKPGNELFDCLSDM